MKTVQQIEADLATASKKKRPVLNECKLIVMQYNEDDILMAKHISSKFVKTCLKRRKDSGDKKLYSEELRVQRRYLRGLKYLLS